MIKNASRGIFIERYIRLNTLQTSRNQYKKIAALLTVDYVEVHLRNQAEASG